jgi:Fic family protein
MKLIDKTYFNQYNQAIGKDIFALVSHFDFNSPSRNLGYQIQASAVYSSNIEGNSIDLNSFMNYKLSKQAHKPKKELQEIEDLILAYEFAQDQALNEKTLLKAHQLLSKKLLITSLRGKYRTDKVGVFGESGLVYLAVEAEFVAATMHDFFTEIGILLNLELSLEEVFYFAALIHLRFAHIHPFRDGNGRTARLLEKWFLAQKLGPAYWKLPSEKMYKENQAAYYQNINLGFNFYELNYNKCLPFLMMLNNTLK